MVGPEPEFNEAVDRVTVSRRQAGALEHEYHRALLRTQIHETIAESMQWRAISARKEHSEIA